MPRAGAAVYPLNTLSNLLEALREGDYSLRGSRAQRGDAIGEVVIEINALSQTLREQRLTFEEKSALLAKVIAALDIAVIAFDEAALKLANPAAERLLARPAENLLGRSADALGLGDWLEIVDARPQAFVSRRQRTLGSASRAISRRRRAARAARHHGSEPHVARGGTRGVAAPTARARARAQQLAGADPLDGRDAVEADRPEPPPPDWRDDGSALDIIGDRAEALARFMARYTALARLPPPNTREIGSTSWRGAPRGSSSASPSQSTTGRRPSRRRRPDRAGADQPDPERDRRRAAAAWRRAPALASCRRSGALEIDDGGPGLPPSENLFVPFFTTKRGGSGIGLVLARQIVEAHGGSLTLENRDDARGCVANFSVPLQDADGARR